MEESSFCLLKTVEFEKWLDQQPARTQVQVAKRLLRISDYGHFGDHKSVSFYDKGNLKDAIWELRWENGKRVYYAYFPKQKILILLGGNKNGQDKNISEAKNLYLKAIKKTREED